MNNTSIGTPTLDETKKTDWLPLLLLLFLSLVWGSSFILMKKGLVVYSYEQVGALRIVFSFLAMLPFVWKGVKQIKRHKWKYVTIMGFLGNFIPAFLFAIAVSKIESSLAGILNALTPLFTLLVGIAAFQSAIKRVQFIGLLLGFIGCAFLSFINGDGGFGPLNFYVLFVVTATICYATSSNIIKAHLSDIPPIPLTACAMVIIGPLATVYLFSTDFTTRLLATQGAWEALGYLAILGVIGTALGLVLFNIIIKRTSAVYATSVTYIIPIVAIAWGVYDGEQLFVLHYLGMALIIGGIYLVNLARKKG